MKKLHDADVDALSPAGLGCGALFAQALGAMAPPYNCIVVGAVIAVLAGHGVVAAFAMAGLAMVSYGYTIAFLAGFVTSTGGLYGIVGSVLGRRAALWFGGAFLLNGFFSIPATVVSAAYLLELIVGSWLPDSVFANSWSIWVAIILPLAFLVSYLGAQVSGRIILTMIGCGMGAILFLDLAILSKAGLEDIPWSTLFIPVSGSVEETTGLLLSGGVAVLTLAGSESAIYLAGEARNPRRHIPWAVYGSIAVAALFYVVTSLAFATALPAQALIELWGKNGPKVIGQLGASYIGEGFAITTLALVAVSAIAGVISFTNYIARVMQAMAEDHYLPARCAALDKRRSPWFAISVLFGLTLTAFVIGRVVVGEGADGAITFFTWLYYAVPVFLISNYVLICVSAVWLGKLKGYSWLRTYPAPCVTIVMMLLAVKSQLTPLPPWPFDLASWCAIGLLLVLVGYTEWRIRVEGFYPSGVRSASQF